MLDFAAFPTHPRYRTLKLSEPRQTGLDVFALQGALADLGDHANPGPLDGILGSQTARAIRAAQEGMFITADGLAGGGTQTALARHLADRVAYRLKLPTGLLLGQLLTESGCRLGNYSPQRADGTYDAGIAQRNTKYTAPRDGFTVLGSIDALGLRLRAYYDKFAGVSGKRRWALAAGSWNAPAFAAYIAREEGAAGVKASETLQPSATARTTLEAYMDSATAMMA